MNQLVILPLRVVRCPDKQHAVTNSLLALVCSGRNINSPVSEGCRFTKARTHEHITFPSCAFEAHKSM